MADRGQVIFSLFIVCGIIVLLSKKTAGAALRAAADSDRGISSAGRASGSQSEGRGFDPHMLH